MPLDVFPAVFSVRIPGRRIRRMCILGFDDSSIVFTCLGLVASIFSASSGPILDYILYKILMRRISLGSYSFRVLYSDIYDIESRVKFGVEIVFIKTLDEVYELVAAGRSFKFGLDEFMDRLRRYSCRMF